MMSTHNDMMDEVRQTDRRTGSNTVIDQQQVL